MPLHTADALILRTYKLGEADRIVVFLTSDRGKLRGVAKGARRLRSRFSGGLEPFTCARVAYVERENRTLVRLTYVEPILSPLVGVSQDMLGYTGYFAELVDEWALEGDPSDRLFRLSSSVSAAAATDVPVERLARYFEYWLLRLQGVYPSLVACQRCDAALENRGAVLIAGVGAFMCWECQPLENGPDLSPRALEFLRMAATLSPERLCDVSLPRTVGRELAMTHQRLIVTHLEKPLKSVPVLQALETTMSEAVISEDQR